MAAHTTSDAKVAPYGTWTSPISADMIASAGISIDSPKFALDGKMYYLERRSSGKTCVVEIDGSTSRDILSDSYDVRSKVHEYGGAAYTVMPSGDIIFTNAINDAVCVVSPTTKHVETILEHPKCRYADFEPHPSKSIVVAIEEEHPTTNPADVLNTLALIDISSATRKTLVQGADFYTTPRISPDGSRICWLQWNHPDMPWTGSQLYVADFKDSGELENITYIAGTAGHESVVQPAWAPDGRLFFGRNETGYWQLSYLEQGSMEPQKFPLKGLEQVDLGTTQWRVGSCTRAFTSTSTYISAYNKEARDYLIQIDLSTGEWQPLDLSICDIRDAAMAGYTDGSFLVYGGTESSPKALYHIQTKPTLSTKLIKTTLDVKYSTSIISYPKHITCPTAGGLVTHGFFYEPKNPDYSGPEDELPPIVVFVHGGPTGHVGCGFTAQLQYFTSRGYAVFNLNYRGSTGYGRDYALQLNHNWGVADADDAVAAVSYLASQKLVDGSRAGITGGSAGGYTTIQALCASSVFAGGVSLYGISDLRSMVSTTHKFESQYLNLLLYDDGMTDEQKEERLRERSAICHVERLSAPLLLLQGSEDKVVPPDQASDMVEIGKKSGLDIEMIVFEGEGHGWRMGKNIKRSLEEEEKWWRKTLLRAV